MLVCRSPQAQQAQMGGRCLVACIGMYLLRPMSGNGFVLFLQDNELPAYNLELCMDAALLSSLSPPVMMSSCPRLSEEPISS